MSKSRKNVYEERVRQAEPESHQGRRQTQRQIDELTRLRLEELDDEWDEFEEIQTFEKIRRTPIRKA